MADHLHKGLERVLHMLEPSVAALEPDTSAGYIDVLVPEGEERSRFPASMAQFAMTNPLFTGIYERYWRPVLGQMLMGPFGPSPARERARAVESLALDGADRVLDVACGTGDFTRHYAGHLTAGGLAVGLDLSAEMLARAVRRDPRPNLAYVRGDAHRLPFPDATFDAVACFAALYLIPDPMTVIDEMVRVLAPGGRLAVMASARSDSTLLALPQTALSSLIGVSMFDRNEIVARFDDAGLRDLDIHVDGLAQFVTGRRPDPREGER